MMQQISMKFLLHCTNCLRALNMLFVAYATPTKYLSNRIFTGGLKTFNSVFALGQEA